MPVGALCSEPSIPGTWPADRNSVFLIVGSCFVVLGGLVAAVTGPLDLDHGSWAAAYLVLVWGAYQYLMGIGQKMLVRTPAPRRLVWGQVIGWNAGSASVVLGSLFETPGLVDAGGFLLLLTLASTLWVVRNADRRILAWSYRVVTAVLMLSVPIGSVLTRSTVA